MWLLEQCVQHESPQPIEGMHKRPHLENGLPSINIIHTCQHAISTIKDFWDIK